MKGTIVMPIAFMANYRGLRYREIEVCFSFDPIEETLQQRCLAHPGLKRDNVKELNRCVTPFDYLLPWKLRECRGYSDFVYERRYHIALGDLKLPSTASTDEFQHFLPCFESALPAMLELLGKPDFYIKKGLKGLSLMIKDRHGIYREFKEQPYCPSTWYGQGHPCMSLPSGLNPQRISTLNWQDIEQKLYCPTR